MAELTPERLREAYAAFNESGPDAVIGFFGPDFVVHDREAIPDPRTHHGVEGFQALFDENSQVYEEFSFEPREFVPIGDQMVVVITIRVRGRGSGVALEQTIVHRWRIEGDLAQEMWVHSTKEEALDAAGSTSGSRPGRS
jgi:SnoaL-like protein